MALPGRLGVLAAAVLLLSGCASGAGTAPPTGVDGLVIPTPSPDPADFVDAIDNPWLPLAAGSEWVYESGDGGTVTVTVTNETREVAGVTTTVVREVVTDARGDVVEKTSDWLAQDRDGNVWFFGTSGSWEAGVDGAEAGLVMPAEPRLGDGYRQAYDEGEVEARAEVVALDGSATVPSGDYDDLLVIEESTPLDPGVAERTYYARGLGPVLEETVSGGSGRLELVSHVVASEE